MASEPATAAGVTEPVAAVERSAWQQVALTDVHSGESFTLADFNGQVVVFETMAVCPLCTQQAFRVGRALRRSDESVVTVSVDV